MTKTKAKEVEPEGPPPNIRFVGKDCVTDKLDAKGNPVVIPAEALRKINAGEETIMLPGEGSRADTAAQAAGFFHPKAEQIVRLFSGFYKLITEKGN